MWWAFCILANMININTIYQLVKQSLGQYQKVNVLPQVFNSSYQIAELDLMNELLGNNTNNLEQIYPKNFPMYNSVVRIYFAIHLFI